MIKPSQKNQMTTANYSIYTTRITTPNQDQLNFPRITIPNQDHLNLTRIT